MVGDILIGDPPGNFGADKRFHLNFTQGCHLILMYAGIPEIKETVLPVNLPEVPVGRLSVGEAPDVDTAEEREFALGPGLVVEFKIMLEIVASAQPGTDFYIGAVVKEPLIGSGTGRDRPAL